MAATVRNDINNTIGTQLNAVTKSIKDLKANLTHITKAQALSDAAATTRMDEIHTATDERFASLMTRYDTRFTAYEQHLLSPLTPWGTTVVDPSISVVDPSNCGSHVTSTPPRRLR